MKVLISFKYAHDKQTYNIKYLNKIHIKKFELQQINKRGEQEVTLSVPSQKSSINIDIKLK